MSVDVCTCRKPKPVDVTEHEDDGTGERLVAVWRYCDRCGGALP